MLTIAEGAPGMLHVRADGQLTTDEYIDFVTELEWFLGERAPPIDMLIELGANFGGWNLDTLFRDKSFSLTQAGTIRRVAIVGDERWEAWASGATYEHLAADIRFFPIAAEGDARRWLASPVADQTL